ncbi:MAG: hypothetical protein M3279_05710 [Actinomycetota bacterium]|nr:hypothetical protein [Actinomycetota bacterium]
MQRLLPASRAARLGFAAALALALVAGSPAAVYAEERLKARIVMSRWLGERPEDDLFTVRPNGRRVRHLTHGKARDISAEWSPDGRAIAFVRDRGSPRRGDALWVMRRDGSEQRKLYEATSVDAFDWSPDGSRLVLSAYEDGERDLYVVEVSTADVSRLTSTPGEDESGPAWSPDGDRIAFASGQRWDEQNVYTIEPDGEGRTSLTEDVSSAAPVWSPDGTHIAFVSWRDDADSESDDGPFIEIYVMDRSGDDETRVSNIERSWDEDHAWVTNDLVAWKARYNDRRNGRPTDTEIFVAGRDGSDRTNLTSNRGFHEGSPAPSPDGRWIAFWRHKDGARKRSGLFKIRVDGSGERKLVGVSSTHHVAPSGLDWGTAPQLGRDGSDCSNDRGSAAGAPYSSTSARFAPSPLTFSTKLS